MAMTDPGSGGRTRTPSPRPTTRRLRVAVSVVTVVLLALAVGLELYARYHHPPLGGLLTEGDQLAPGGCVEMGSSAPMSDYLPTPEGAVTQRARAQGTHPGSNPLHGTGWTIPDPPLDHWTQTGQNLYTSAGWTFTVASTPGQGWYVKSVKYCRSSGS